MCLIFLDIRHRGYARRYALFTLVGIAGEDDLDAPDLVAPTPQTKSSGPERARRSMAPNGRLNADQRRVEHRTPIERPQKTSPVHDAVMPDTQLSARLRDQMIAELNELGTGDEAARWAKRRYPDKTKRLNAADAEHIDQCFRTKILSFAAHDAEGAGVDIEGASAEPSAQPNGRGAKKPKQAKSIDKSTLSFPEPRRVRDREHVRHVAQQSCLVCGRKPCDAHHLRFAQTRALGRKVSDEFTVPLCRGSIVKSTDTAMKPNGGAKPRSIHSQLPGPCGLRRIPDCNEHIYAAARWSEIRSARGHAAETPAFAV